ncbi:LTA synthase family protein [Trueperella abortisuis]|uniref:Phosphoglycerol transferase n=1 Tax=Trueperella abortisuis TaxID=445930 RepID=A0ABT9PHD5_9ACTO|nr:LTA synthase family protein [Trueperella abortisuis]MDP9831555.1 phosphoglycerol transferase [Trueperella abortisuis]
MFLAIQVLTITILLIVAIRMFGGNVRAVARGIAAGIVSNAALTIGWTFARAGTFFYGTTASPWLLLVYFLLVLALGLAILALLRLSQRHFTYKDRPWRLRELASVLAGAVLGALIALFTFVPKVITDSVDNVTADQILFILTQGNGETTPERALEFINLMIAPTAWLALVGACIGLISSDLVLGRGVDASPATADQPQSTTRRPLRFRHVRGVAFVAMLATLAGSIAYAAHALPLADMIRQQFVTSNYIENNFVMATPDNVHLPQKKRNLIHIYMESIENSFYSADLGGYREYNVMPELAELSRRGVSFSHNELAGGPQQLYATGHSVAAMVAMWAGTPMLASGAGNGTQMSYPDFPTIGDFLHDAGYATDFMVGSDSTWGGVRDYYRRHGDFTIHDLTTFRAEGRVPKNYMVWWGVEDDKLYDYARDVLTERGNGDKPFYFILENADTHWPDGYLSPNMTDQPFPTQYENVIHYSQAQTVKLVEWILDQPWAADTTIVITGDHRSMDKEFFKDWDKSYNRTVVNLILNPVQGTDLPKEITKNRQYASFDFFPTILSAIGATIDGDRLGLGTNLFSGTPTLVERDGTALLNQEFAKRSPFYDKHRETKAQTPDVNQDNKF